MPARARRTDPIDVDGYYRHPAVRRRLLEYCGAVGGAAPTAVYVASLQEDRHPYLTWARSGRWPVERIDAICRQQADLSRSLWDTENLIFVIDIDHQNLDAPWEPFTHPADVFLKLEPVHRAVSTVLGGYGIAALDVMTGRGYHFVGRIGLDHPVVDALAALVPAPPSWLDTLEARRPPGVTAALGARQARAWSGLGLLLEHAAHDVIRRATRLTQIPVVVNGTVVGRGALGRECASIDFSHAGDPLDVRHIRIAYSAYQWHRFRPDIFGPMATSLPPLVALPRGRSLLGLLQTGRSLETGVSRAAHAAPVGLPDVTRGVERLLRAYAGSPLARVHREFYAETGVTRADPPDLAVPDLPPCLGACLATPNDLLLRPEHLQYLTRGLLMRGWRAGRIARLVQTAYEADHGWGDRWTRLDARTRAEFDVRVFAGLVLTGLDRMVDYNCVSAQEKGVCPGTGCACDLRIERDRFLSRGER